MRPATPSRTAGCEKPYDDTDWQVSLRTSVNTRATPGAELSIEMTSERLEDAGSPGENVPSVRLPAGHDVATEDQSAASLFLSSLVVAPFELLALRSVAEILASSASRNFLVLVHWR